MGKRRKRGKSRLQATDEKFQFAGTEEEVKSEPREEQSVFLTTPENYEDFTKENKDVEEEKVFAVSNVDPIHEVFVEEEVPEETPVEVSEEVSVPEVPIEEETQSTQDENVYPQEVVSEEKPVYEDIPVEKTVTEPIYGEEVEEPVPVESSEKQPIEEESVSFQPSSDHYDYLREQVESTIPQDFLNKEEPIEEKTPTFGEITPPEEEKVEEVVPEEPVYEDVHVEEPVPEPTTEEKIEEPTPTEAAPVSPNAVYVGVSDDTTIIPTIPSGKRLKKKVHFSFEARVVAMILCILIMFIAACLLIVETIRYGNNKSVTYHESSEGGYSVCPITSNVDCLAEDMEYNTSIVDTIHTYFRYNADFSTDISYNIGYHVSAFTKIYDRQNPIKVYYDTEDVLLEKVKLSDVNSFISFETDVSLDFRRFNNNVISYLNQYGFDALGEVKIALFLDEENDVREVASFVVPLGKDSFRVTKNMISSEGSVQIDGNFWNEYNLMCAIIASILILISVFLLYRTTLWVLRVTSNRSKYQQKLDQILREYDRIIVIARDGYESDTIKPVVKLQTFDDLLDAHSENQKPIIYSRINDVRSDFIIEGDNQLYKYSLKEKDFRI